MGAVTIGGSANSAVEVLRPTGNGGLVIVCEHASNRFPDKYHGLGLDDSVRESHAAWDPGAFQVAKKLSEHFASPLVASTVSRLIYDCNRPPESPTAIVEKSEIYNIPGNTNLSSADREQRVTEIYKPFHNALDSVIDQRIKSGITPAVVTVHSFTPVYNGIPRSVELGLLHDTDSRLANAMYSIAPVSTKLNVQLNQPYGPTDGVMHTLQKHALPRGLMNVMIEVKNDLLLKTSDIDSISTALCDLLQRTLVQTS